MPLAILWVQSVTQPVTDEKEAKQRYDEEKDRKADLP